MYYSFEPYHVGVDQRQEVQAGAFTSDQHSYDNVYSAQVYFSLLSFCWTTIISIKTSLVQHHYSHDCTSARPSDYVLNYCKRYHVEVFSRQKIQAIIIFLGRPP